MVSTAVKIVVVVLVLSGAAGLIFLLAMAIRGEFVRTEDHSDAIGKMLVVVNASTKRASEDAEFLLGKYNKFIRTDGLDADFAYQDTEDGLSQVNTIIAQLHITEADQTTRPTPTELKGPDAVYNGLLGSLSPEGTKEDPEAETTVRMLTLMTVDQSIIEGVLTRLVNSGDVSNVQMLVFEAWPTEVKFGYLETNDDAVRHLATFDSLQATRKKLCPGIETTHDDECV